MSDDHGTPYVEVPAKRSADKVPVQFDWHDYLASQWQPGAGYGFGARVRGSRLQSTGFEYEATTGGVSGRRRPNFPSLLGATVIDGSVTWTARAISTASLRATILTSAFTTVAGITLSNESNDDLVYTVYAEDGVSGQRYPIQHRITLSSALAEVKEAVAVLLVAD